MKNWPWFIVSLVVVLLDQASKYWAIVTLMPYQPEAIWPMVNVTLAYNTGAAFSFLNNAGEWHRWFFVGFSFFMSTCISVWLTRVLPFARLQLVAVSLVLGGAVGNLIDRIRLGYVVDFIDVYYKNHHWPVFNVADSGICIGAVLLLMDMFLNNGQAAEKKTHAACP